MRKEIKRTTKLIQEAPKKYAKDGKEKINNIDTNSIKKQAKGIARATGVMVSAFSVVGLTWLIGHKRK